MAALRRHLASLGLAVVLFHTIVQALVPAALCCGKTTAATPTAQAKHACCIESEHHGGICPMHGAAPAHTSPDSRDCRAKSRAGLHDMVVALTAGAVMPSLVGLAAPAGSEATPVSLQPSLLGLSLTPLGPPPRS
jgi:hypothetical protein